MKIDRWFKKDVTLVWNGRVTRYAVAQELFSSHDVDAGSKALLRSLDASAFPDSGHVADLGCGCGVLGLAWKDQFPEWDVDLIDRDMLAVGFSRHNARHVSGGIAAITGLGPPEGPYDLILWNVPGKAGAMILPGLTHDALAALKPGGTLALVVVNPLVDVIHDGMTVDGSVTLQLEERHADHTVMHIRRESPTSPPGDPFDRGRFDRGVAEFGVDDLDYDILPVVGLPEYDSYSYATQVTLDMLQTVNGSVGTALIFRPGQGHLPIVVTHGLAPSRMILVDRDLLALRASERAMRDGGLEPGSLHTVAAVDLCDVAEESPVSFCLLMLEDQVRNEVHAGRLEDLPLLMPVGGQLVVGGTSSVVSRFLKLAAKTGCWKVRSRTKRNGASAVRLELLGGA